MDKFIVIKCGGSMIDSLSSEFYESIKKLKDNGFKPIIVHGGGPAINKLLNELQIQSEFVNGLRKTTHEVMEVVEMVLSGSMTNKLVRELQKHGISAIGITGSDGGLMYAEAKDKDKLGLVGEVTSVNQNLLLNLVSMDIVPVISPIAMSLDGSEMYNINADTAAAAVAVSLKADKILFVTDVPGVIKDNQMIDNLTTSEVLTLINDGVISGGMIPKVMAAVHSLEGGMSEAMIVSGKSTLLVEDSFLGTSIKKVVEVVK